LLDAKLPIAESAAVISNKADAGDWRLQEKRHRDEGTGTSRLLLIESRSMPHLPLLSTIIS